MLQTVTVSILQPEPDKISVFQHKLKSISGLQYLCAVLSLRHPLVYRGTPKPLIHFFPWGGGGLI